MKWAFKTSSLGNFVVVGWETAFDSQALSIGSIFVISSILNYFLESWMDTVVRFISSLFLLLFIYLLFLIFERERESCMVYGNCCKIHFMEKYKWDENDIRTFNIIFFYYMVCDLPLNKLKLCICLDFRLYHKCSSSF